MKIDASENVQGISEWRNKLNDPEREQEFDLFWADVPVFDITNQDHCMRAAGSCSPWQDPFDYEWTFYL